MIKPRNQRPITHTHQFDMQRVELLSVRESGVSPYGLLVHVRTSDRREVTLHFEERDCRVLDAMICRYYPVKGGDF